MSTLKHSATCSKNAKCRWEGRSWPEVLEWNAEMSKLAGKPRPRNQIFSRTSKEVRVSSSSPALVGPGAYRSDRDFPLDADEEFVSPTGKVSLTTTLATSEARAARDGILKGMSTEANNRIPNRLGPGQYSKVDPAASRRVAASYSMSRGTDEARDRKALLHKPGPGAYNTWSALTEAGRERYDIEKRLPRHCKESHHASAFGNIFSTMRSKKPTELAAGKVASARPVTENEVVLHCSTFGR